MISLRPMKPDEFQPYLDHFIPQYVADLVANYAMSPDKAHKRVIKELETDFPDGVNTKKQTLMCIETDTQTVGVLWYNTNNHMAFIAEFEIYAEFQNQGLGTQTMRALEEHLVKHGITEIHLRVAADNPRAQRLYAQLGFVVTGVKMMRKF